MAILAVKNLLHDKGKFVQSVLGIALAIALILIIEGFGEGIRASATVYMNNTGADMFVAQDGVENMQSARSVVPLSALPIVRDLPGVRRASPIYSIPVQFNHGGHRTPIMLIGYRTKGGMGGPWAMGRGRRPAKSGEAVFDLSLALREDIAIGEKVNILGGTFKVLGFSRETASFMNPYVFVPYADAARLASEPDSASFLLVKLGSGARAATVSREIEREVPGVTAVRTAKLAEDDRKQLDDIMGRPINVMLAITYVIGILVVGLTVYVDVVDRLREYGVLKAIGSSNAYLYRQVLAQSVAGTVLGFVVGIGVAYLAKTAIEYAFPRFVLVLAPSALQLAAVLSLAMGTIASVIPIARISGIDPVEVFER